MRNAEKKTTNTPGLMLHTFLLSQNVVVESEITPFLSFPVSKALQLSRFHKCYCQKHSTNWQNKSEQLPAEQIAPLNFANKTKESYPVLSESGQRFLWECLSSECREREHIEVTAGLDSSPRRFSSDRSHQHGNIARSKKKEEKYWRRIVTSN